VRYSSLFLPRAKLFVVIVYGAFVIISASELLVDTPRRCEASLLLNIRLNIPRICINRNIMTAATNVQTIIRCKLQHFFFELLLFPPPLFPICISVPDDADALGGRRKLPAPRLGVIPADRFVFRRCSPCSSLGGRRACRELIFCDVACLF
jgi:hypothetical protein